jgi:hypothetical protein
MFLRGFANAVEHNTWFDIRQLLFRIEPVDGSHVLREVEHHGDITALPRETGAASAWKYRCAKFAACGKGRLHICNVSGNDQAERYLTIIGSVGSV